jgi:hypothetical protein
MHPSSPTPSPQGKQPESKPSEMSPREMIESAMAASIMEVMQLRRTLWLILQQTGPITIDEAKTHPLWRMKATRQSPTTVTLEAAQLPDPTQEQLTALVEILHGSKTPLPEAMDSTELRDHPPAYVQMLLTPKLVQNDEGYWVDAALARIAQSPPTQNN